MKPALSNRNIGAKEVNYDAELWDDHDEDCHGRMECFEDDSDYQEGFIWSCCGKSGANKGCFMSNHKTKVAIPQTPSLAASNKRKAEEDIVRPATYARIV